jgi:dCMP deaminase
MKNKFKLFYMKTAILVSELSYCGRRKVGSILVKDGRIMSTGFNGTPSGWENICESSNNVTHDYVLHAEANCLMKMATSNESSEDSSLFVTTIPCIHCAKLIAQAKIKDVYYLEEYHSDTGKNHLIKCGIDVRRITIND